MNRSLSDIKHAQKESLLLRELSNYFLKITMDDERLKSVSLHRVKLSKDKSLCTLFFFTPQGAEHFQEVKPFLVLYKPSMRKALAQSISGRYTPQLVFDYDSSFEKHLQINHILDTLKDKE